MGHFWGWWANEFFSQQDTSYLLRCLEALNFLCATCSTNFCELFLSFSGLITLELNTLQSRTFSEGTNLSFKWLSSEGSEFGGSGSTDTDLTMSYRLVSHRELSQIVTNHISLDFDWVPVLSTVDVNNGVAHLWDDDAISKMSFDTLWFFSWFNVFLGFSELLNKSLVLAVNTVSESSLLSRFH